MNFWSGQVVVRYPDGEEALEARVFIDVDFDLKIEVPNSLRFLAAVLGASDNMVCEIPEIAEPIGLLLSHTATLATGEEVLVLSPTRSPLWKRSAREMLKGRASLVNFLGFKSKKISSSVIQLEDAKWRITMIPIGESRLSYPPLLQSDEHKITHQIEFERADGAAFSDGELFEFVQDLSLFFSFCHGGWISVGLALGTDRDGVVSGEEWGIGRIGPPDDPDGFLDRLQTDGLFELYPLFMQKLRDPGWADVISHAVYWLRRSNMDNAGPDGGIILLQAVLERFAWHVLVRQQEAISEKGFGDLTAADQLRLLVNALRLPRAVPEGLEDLASFAKANNLDAAEAFTRVRNRIVHPPKLRAREEKLPYYDTYRLGRWYVELAVLSACTYTGEYSNRTRKDQWVGQVERVPWAK